MRGCFRGPNALLGLAAASVLAAITPAYAADLEVGPFALVNQSPLSQIFGLPSNTDPALVPAGHFALGLSEDIASDYAVDGNAREALTLDGESYRTTLALRYGIGGTYEIGAELPAIYYTGGFLDDTIIGYHQIFGFPQGGRDMAPRNRLLFSYLNASGQRFQVDEPGLGLGDASLTGGMKLGEVSAPGHHDLLTLRTSLALPTGRPGRLSGSGAPDLSLFLAASDNRFTSWGDFGLFGSLGEMALGAGQVLGGMQNRAVTFGTIGAGWSPVDWGSIKMELVWNSPFFHGSALPELSRNAMMLVTGGTVQLPAAWKLDLDFSEDVAVTTAPDIAFGMGLSRQF